MNRTEIIQKVLDRKKASSYLEIGAGSGENFFPIKVKSKIAVDPHFSHSPWQKIIWNFRNPDNRKAVYYTLASDSFFSRAGTLFQPDLVFIDGLHTSQQTLKDINNSLGILSRNGVIMVHDCNPSHEAAAYPAESFDQAASQNLPGWTGVWCGDVWKAICHLRSRRRDLNIFVLDCDFGLGFITKGTAAPCLDIPGPEIDTMTYDDLSRNRQKLLNLKDETFLSEYLAGL